MKRKLLKVMIKITEWCYKLAFKLGLDEEMDDMVLLNAKLSFKYDQLKEQK